MKNFFIYSLLFIVLTAAFFLGGNYLLEKEAGILDIVSSQFKEGAPATGGKTSSSLDNPQDKPKEEGLMNSEHLVLFYNKDLIKQAPKTWRDLKQTVVDYRPSKEETTDNSPGEFNAVIPLGLADNISYSSEIFITLLKQQGGRWPRDLGGELGQRALQFYNEFANPNKKVFNWSQKIPNSLEAFKSGQTALLFAQLADKEKFANINYEVLDWPVIQGSHPEGAIATEGSRDFQDIPPISPSIEAIISEMIESVADNRATIKEATQQAYEEIKEFNL